MDSIIVRRYCDFHAVGTEEPDMKMIFVEPYSGQQIVRYEREVMDAEYHLNRNFALSHTLTLNDFYKMFGFEERPKGDIVGWSMYSGINWLDFDHEFIGNDEETGMPMVELSLVFPPTEEDLLDID